MSLPTTSLNRKDLFLRACRGEAVPRLPVWMMRQAGRYLPEYREIRAKRAFLEVCKTPDLALEVSMQPFRRLGVDAVIVFSDILIPAEAMGLKLELGDSGPNLPEPVRSESDIEKLRIFDPETETGFLTEAIRRIVREVGPTVPVLGFAGAPWTLACYMVEGRTKEGFATVKSLLYHQRDALCPPPPQYPRPRSLRSAARRCVRGLAVQDRQGHGGIFEGADRGGRGRRATF